MAYHSLRSKLNRAVAAYLIKQGNDCGGADDIVAANTRTLKAYPNTTIRSTLSRPEVMGTGTERVQLQISIKGSALEDDSGTTSQVQRVQFDKRCAATKDAMMQSGNQQNLRAAADLITAAGRAIATPVDASPEAEQFAADNADMADFTCIDIFDQGEGDGTADAPGCSWEEVFLFEALAAPSNVD